ncbi:MAG: hypothetical protein Q8K80_03965 [Methylotenera sp.]|nr:hypothetical protein [Methylotenera sp.]MDP1754670.1 hypothetical protein [Methylotenera sp.]MDP1959787.1 hypothetical protein [Methylotenera sp.]MDP3942623.1 hypothetical protein [Methylotenera sp.]
MNDDRFKGLRFLHSVIDELLKYWAFVIGSRCTWLNILMHD